MVRKIVWWILTVSCAALILGFSLQSVADSIRLSGTITDIVLEQDESYQQLSHDYQVIKNDKLHDFLRSTAHVCLFSALAFCSAMLARSYTEKQWILIAAPACMLFAFLDEGVQHFRNAGRAFQLSDVWRDWLGTAIGVAIAVAVVELLWWHTNRRKQEESSHGVSGTGAGYFN